MRAGAVQPLSRVTVRRADPLEGTALYFWTLRLAIWGVLLLTAQFGSPLMCLAALLAGLLLPLLDRAGGVWCALVGASCAAAFAATAGLTVPFALWACQEHGWPFLPTAIGAVGLVFIPALCIGGIVGSWTTRPLRQYRYAHVVNRTSGALAAVVVGALATALTSWTFDLYGPAISKYSDAASAKYPNLTYMIKQLNLARCRIMQDPTTYWFTQHNPLWRVEPLVALAARAELSADNHRLWKEFYAGELKDLLEIPVIRKYYITMKADRQLKKAFDRHDLATILNSRYIAEAVNDDELTEVVAAHWPEIRAHVSDRQIIAAKAAIAKLDSRSRSRFDQLMRRARELGIDDPWAPATPR